jgi:hypothetical protein
VAGDKQEAVEIRRPDPKPEIAEPLGGFSIEQPSLNFLRGGMKCRRAGIESIAANLRAIETAKICVSASLSAWQSAPKRMAENLIPPTRNHT